MKFSCYYCKQIKGKGSGDVASAAEIVFEIASPAQSANARQRKGKNAVMTSRLK